ncbi:MAG: MmcQ/YjbR family DNA-binding protein [Cyclobacteriaceae bacterium]
MNIEQFRNYCLSKTGTTEETPFGPTTLVFKVVGKLLDLRGLETFESINLKCDPERAMELREKYDCVVPGYHMNKRHWNTVIMDGSISDELILEWIDHSYDLVVQGLSKQQRGELEKL